MGERRDGRSYDQDNEKMIRGENDTVDSILIGVLGKIPEASFKIVR